MKIAKYTTKIGILLLGLNIILLPFLFKQKLETQIFNFDIYAIWISGLYCFAINYFHGSLLINFKLALSAKISFLYLLLFLCTITIVDTFHISYLISFFCYCNITIFVMHFGGNTSLKFFIYTLFVSLLIQIFIASKQAVEQQFYHLSIIGTFSNSGFFANYLSFLIPLTVLFIKKENKKIGVFYPAILTLLLSLLILLLTRSRSAILGCSIGLIFYYSYQRISLSPKKTFIIFSSLASIVVILILFRLDSAVGRLTIYKNSIRTFLDNIFFGVGPGYFSSKYNEYQLEYFSNPNIGTNIRLLGDNVHEAFNILLQILVEYGALGFLALTILLIGIFKTALHSNQISLLWKKGIFGALIVVFCSSLFSNPFHIPAILFSVVILIGLITPVQSHTSLKHRRPSRLIFTIPCFLLIAYTILWKTVSSVRGELLWDKAINVANFEGYKVALPVYELAYKDLVHDGNFLYNYGAVSLLNHDYRRANKILLEAKKYDTNSDLELLIGQSFLALQNTRQAEYHFVRAINITPSHFFPRYHIINLYINIGEIGKAKLAIRSALQTPIKVKTPEVDAILSRIKELDQEINKDSYTPPYVK